MQIVAVKINVCFNRSLKLEKFLSKIALQLFIIYDSSYGLYFSKRPFFSVCYNYK